MAKRPRDPEFYICPSCKMSRVYLTGHDLRKQPVYECEGCKRKFGEQRLEDEAQQRRLLD